MWLGLPSDLEVAAAEVPDAERSPELELENWRLE